MKSINFSIENLQFASEKRARVRLRAFLHVFARKYVKINFHMEVSRRLWVAILGKSAAGGFFGVLSSIFQLISGHLIDFAGCFRVIII